MRSLGTQKSAEQPATWSAQDQGALWDAGTGSSLKLEKLQVNLMTSPVKTQQFHKMGKTKDRLYASTSRAIRRKSLGSHHLGWWEDC